MRRTCIAFLIVVSAKAGCTLVDSDKLTGADLARADERFAALPADKVVGFAPTAGVRRVMDVRQLSLLARQNQIPVEGLAAVCFERPTTILTAEQLRAAMERAAGDGTKIEVVDFSRYPVSPGEISFAIRDLAHPPLTRPDEPVIWRGVVRYGSRGTAVIWAKVRVSRLEHWVETAAAIQAHARIQPGQLAAKSGWRFPFERSSAVDTVEAASGMQAARTLPAGQILTMKMLEQPAEVQKGETVDVEVASGEVSLRFAARAESTARRNESVLVTLLDSGRKLQAKVQEKGKVIIDADSRKKTDKAPARGGSTFDSAAYGNSGRSAQLGGQSDSEASGNRSAVLAR